MPDAIRSREIRSRVFHGARAHTRPRRALDHHRRRSRRRVLVSDRPRNAADAARDPRTNRGAHPRRSRARPTMTDDEMPLSAAELTTIASLADIPNGLVT